MNKELKEIIEYEYLFLDCPQGCWKSGDQFFAISTMETDHILNCVNMIQEKYLPVSSSDKYHQEIEDLLDKKLEELRSEVARRI